MVDKSVLFPTARDRVAVALDTSDWREFDRLVGELSGVVGWFKVGLVAFLNFGERAIGRVRAAGARVFLDLKFHDIPSIVSGAAAAIGEMGVSMLTVHATGGPEMVSSALSAKRVAERCGLPEPAVVAVTVLTSISEGVWAKMLPGAPPVGESALRLAKAAVSAGADGVVCSPLEARRMREELGEGAILVTPGIRPAGEEASDQARFSAPEGAISAGSDLLVVGRPITKAKKPAEAVQAIISEIEMALKGREGLR